MPSTTATSRILLLPGMGDIYWVATALQSFIERRELGVPDVYIWDFDGRPRSLGYVERIPFVRAAGYCAEPIHRVRREFDHSYMRRGGSSVFPGLLGFDYYIAVNSALRWGRTVEDAMKGYDVDWFFPMKTTPDEERLGAKFRELYGDYVVAHFSDFGMFSNWVRRWNAADCAEFVGRIHAATDMPVLLTGCQWDKPFSDRVAELADGAVNIVGDTSLDAFFGLYRNARGCVGWCGGNTIKATYLRVPTLIGWSNYFSDERFFRNACPPQAWETWYRAFKVETTTPAAAAEMFVGLL